MAQQEKSQSSSRSTGRRSSSGGRGSARERRSPNGGSSRGRDGGRSASQKPEEYRFAQNLGGEESVAEREYRAYAAQAREDPGNDPDVLLAVPVVKVDSIHLGVDDLEANVSLQAKVLELLDIDVGVEAHLGRVRIDIRGVEAQALLKVRLDHIAAIVDRVMTTLDRNPELVESIGRAVEQVGAGAEETLGRTGEAAGEIGAGARKGVAGAGHGAGRGVGELGEQGEEGLAGVGDTAGQAVGQLTGGEGGRLSDAVENVAEAASNVPGAARARTAARSMAQAGSAVAGGAAELGEAAARKALDISPIGEGGGESLDATDAAKRAARELGVNLSDVEGSGSGGRITVDDVRSAASGG